MAEASQVAKQHGDVALARSQLIGIQVVAKRFQNSRCEELTQACLLTFEPSLLFDRTDDLRDELSELHVALQKHSSRVFGIGRGFNICQIVTAGNVQSPRFSIVGDRHTERPIEARGLCVVVQNVAGCFPNMQNRSPAANRFHNQSCTGTKLPARLDTAVPVLHVDFA